MYYFLLLILFLLVMSYFREGYLNYEELSFKGVKKNCPQIHANNFNRIVSPDRLEQFFGDYSSEFSDIDPTKKPEKIIEKKPKKVIEKDDKSEDKSDDKELEEQPEIIVDNKIKSAPQLLQYFGYTKNELFDITRFIETDVPFPTDPDFFKHI